MATLDMIGALQHIAEIDQAFAKAKGYGSWMPSMSSYREHLVRYLAEHCGIQVPHKHQLS